MTIKDTLQVSVAYRPDNETYLATSRATVDKVVDSVQGALTAADVAVCAAVLGDPRWISHAT
jgi:hypothetical protein